MISHPLNIGNTIPVPPAPQLEKEIMAGWKGDISTPMVSIVCHTYNHVDYIENALDGFLMQKTQFPFEIIIHDDASSDGTTRIVEKYAKAYPNIVLPIIQTQNQYSKGVKPSTITFPLAKGKYIAMCEGDDYWVNANKLMIQVNAMLRHPNIGISIHPAYRLDMHSSTVIDDFLKGNCEQIFTIEKCVESQNQYAPTASYLFEKREALSLPQWYFTSKDLPFGDYFIETIIGRNGILYLPDIRSVYRRNVIGSYTDRTAKLSEHYLINRMKTVIKYTNKLHDYSEIPPESILKRKKHIIKDYQSTAINRKSLSMLKKINNFAQSSNIESNMLNTYILNNRIGFIIYHKSTVSVSELKKILKSFIKI